MIISEEKKREYARRLLLSRMRILADNGFYGLLLMHMGYGIDENCATAATDGKKIIFGPAFLEEISDRELDFVMMHEVLHVALRHCMRRGERDGERFNIACDIVVNSNILFSKNMDARAITLEKYGESMHLAPDGKEGYEYTAEQVYEMLDSPERRSAQGHQDKSVRPGAQENNGKPERRGSQGGKPRLTGGDRLDDHSRWGTYEGDDELSDMWARHLEDACRAMEAREAIAGRGLLPMFAERMIGRLRNPQADWRLILSDFIQEETVDYSFMPPDRRFEESPFFLPDFNEKEDVVCDILFMVDTSGSISDEMLNAAYSEVKGAIDQFDGKLKGWLGFFDAAVTEPEPFEDGGELSRIKPAGGGGTDFGPIFDHVRRNMQGRLPACIVILTDGYAPFPQKDAAMGIPVLWLLNNEQVTPPWGKVARIRV